MSHETIPTPGVRPNNASCVATLGKTDAARAPGIGRALCVLAFAWVGLGACSDEAPGESAPLVDAPPSDTCPLDADISIERSLEATAWELDANEAGGVTTWTASYSDSSDLPELVPGETVALSVRFTDALRIVQSPSSARIVLSARASGSVAGQRNDFEVEVGSRGTMGLGVDVLPRYSVTRQGDVARLEVGTLSLLPSAGARTECISMKLRIPDSVPDVSDSQTTIATQTSQLEAFSVSVTLTDTAGPSAMPFAFAFE